MGLDMSFKIEERPYHDEDPTFWNTVLVTYGDRGRKAHGWEIIRHFVTDPEDVGEVVIDDPLDIDYALGVLADSWLPALAMLEVLNILRIRRQEDRNYLYRLTINWC